MPLTADEVIQLLHLRPLEGEGGYFAESYRSDWNLQSNSIPGAYPAERVAATAIYFLVTPEQFSALHRLRGDEMWHFYLGDPVELIMLHPDGFTESIRLGIDLRAGERPQALTPAGSWLGCELVEGGTWALLGTTMTPGFHPDDFELGDQKDLLAAFPHAADLIARLTRGDA